MTAYHIEANACTNRGFAAIDPNGFAEKIRQWIPKLPNDATVGNRGPGWFIIDDQSALLTDAYIVVSDQPTPAPNSRARIMQVFIQTSVASMAQFKCWFYWNPATHVGSGLWDWFNVPTVDTGVFGYDLRGGPEFMWIASFIAGALVFGGIETWSRINSAVEDDTVIGTLANPFFKESGDGSGRLSGYHNITGITFTSGNTDAGFNLYFSIVSAGGGNFFVNIYKDSARTLLVGHTANFSTVGAKAITADNSSGIGGTITADIAPAADVGISCRFLKADLGSGEGARFTVGNNYFMFDAQTVGGTIVGYQKVRAISGDTITLEKYTAGKNFPAGAVIGAFPHRFVGFSQRHGNGTGSNLKLRFPYVDSFGQEYADTTGNDNRRTGDIAQIESAILRAQVDQYGNYFMQPGSIQALFESTANAFLGSRFYGQPKNFRITHSSGLSVYSFGRTLASKQFLDIFHSTVPVNLFAAGSWGFSDPVLALCVRDTAETS